MRISATNLNGYLELHDERGQKLPRVGDVCVEIGGECLEFPHISIRELMQFVSDAIASIKSGENAAIILVPDFEQQISISVERKSEIVSIRVDGLVGETIGESISLDEFYSTSVDWA